VINVFFTKLKDKKNKAKCEKVYNTLKRFLKYSNGGINLYVSTDKGYESLIKRLNDEGYKCSLEGNKKEGWFITVSKGS
jgi:hypothetical protein